MYSRVFRTIGLIVSIVACVASAVVAGDPMLVGKGSMPQWSPDNQYISFIRNDSLLVTDTSAVDKTKLLCTGSIKRYYWTEPGRAVAEIQYVRPDSGSIGNVSIILDCDIDGQTKVLSYDSTGSYPTGRSKNYRLERFSDGSIGYYFVVDSVQDIRLLSEANAQQMPDPGFYVRSTPYPNGPKLQYTLPIDGKQCLYPRLAPTRDKFCCENYNGELVVYDTSGAFISNLGQVEWSSWNSSGEWVIYEIMDWGHYDLIGSDIGIAKFDGSRQQRLTFSNENDQRASFSRDGRKVLFREGKTGEIFVLLLKE
jgi:dipeptidyl aminopeptidase/acylaminoacyl peptidase